MRVLASKAVAFCSTRTGKVLILSWRVGWYAFSVVIWGPWSLVYNAGGDALLVVAVVAYQRNRKGGRRGTGAA